MNLEPESSNHAILGTEPLLPGNAAAAGLPALASDLLPGQHSLRTVARIQQRHSFSQEFLPIQVKVSGDESTSGLDSIISPD